MTRSGLSNSRWCFDCEHFDYLMFHIIGVCNKHTSSHYKHLISDMHPACPKYRKKK